MKILLIFLVAGLICAQTSSNSRSTVVKVTSGASYCTFTNFHPMAMTGLHIDCGSATTAMKLDLVMAIGSSGHSGSFNAPDSITWTFRRTTADGALMYKVVANGKTETGSL